MARTYRDRHSKPQPGGREGQLGAGSAEREKLQVPERSNLRFELFEKEVRCGWGGEGPSPDPDRALPGMA